jgi:hypothetical protein
MSNVADYAQSLLDKDQARGDALRSQMFNEYASNRDFGYNQYRDNVGDTRYADETAYNRNRDTLGDQYRDKRDSINDQRYTDETAYNHSRDKRSDFESDRNYNRGVFESDRGYNADQKWKGVDQNNWLRQFNADQKQRGIDNAYRRSGGGGGGSYANPYYVNQQPRLDLNNVNMNDLLAYYASVMNGKNGNPTVPYGSKAYIDKMNKLQY